MALTILFLSLLPAAAGQLASTTDADKPFDTITVRIPAEDTLLAWPNRLHGDDDFQGKTPQGRLDISVEARGHKVVAIVEMIAWDGGEIGGADWTLARCRETYTLYSDPRERMVLEILGPKGWHKRWEGARSTWPGDDEKVKEGESLVRAIEAIIDGPGKDVHEHCVARVRLHPLDVRVAKVAPPQPPAKDVVRLGSHSTGLLPFRHASGDDDLGKGAKVFINVALVPREEKLILTLNARIEEVRGGQATPTVGTIKREYVLYGDPARRHVTGIKNVDPLWKFAWSLEKDGVFTKSFVGSQLVDHLVLVGEGRGSDLGQHAGLLITLVPLEIEVRTPTP